MGLSNVRFRQGDVGALPFEDGGFDLVLSLNGFHAFPDKDAAFQETFRVMKPGGTFCGCFYIAGQNKRTIRKNGGFYENHKLTVPDLISIGVFTALYFVLVTIATFGSAARAGSDKSKKGLLTYQSGTCLISRYEDSQGKLCIGNVRDPFPCPLRDQVDKAQQILTGIPEAHAWIKPP